MNTGRYLVESLHPLRHNIEISMCRYCGKQQVYDYIALNFPCTCFPNFTFT